MTTLLKTTIRTALRAAFGMTAVAVAWGAAPLEGHGALTVLVTATDASMQNYVVDTGVNANGEAYNRISAEYYAASRNQSAAAAMLETVRVLKQL